MKTTNLKGIDYRKGDATSPIGEGNKLIVQICNDIGGWGKGFVVAISKKWRAPELHYRQWFKSNEAFGLGEVQFVKVEETICVANMIAQHNIKRTHGQVPIRYDAVEKCLEKVTQFALENSFSIHMPRIGCGLAGGKWSEIEKIIERTLIAANLTVIVYDFE